MDQITREELIAAVIRASNLQDTPLSRRDFQKLTGIRENQIYRLFPNGGWAELKRQANLDPHPRTRQKMTDDYLLEEFHRVVINLGKIPNWALFASLARISPDVIRRRFGGNRGTIKRYRDWLLINCPDSPILDKLTAESVNTLPNLPEKTKGQENILFSSWNKNENIEFGQPLDFRGLRHAPINEQGVIFLFAMISYEIGFIIEAIHASFPDCEGKRCIDKNKNRWQRVRIEFEFKSSSFRAHGHNPELCDLIICWENDWYEAPIEVIELKTLIHKLDNH